MQGAGESYFALIYQFCVRNKKEREQKPCKPSFLVSDLVSRVTVIWTFFRCYNGGFSNASTLVDGPSVAVGEILWWSRNVVGWTTISHDYGCDQLVSVLRRLTGCVDAVCLECHTSTHSVSFFRLNLANDAADMREADDQTTKKDIYLNVRFV